MEPHALDGATSVFLRNRPRLFGIAYRMLGSAAEAEDVLQDSWLRWQATDHGRVQDPTAFLVTITARLALNANESARVRGRHETCVGPWLPEPVDTRSDPALGAERGEALSFGVLLLLEKFSPAERAAYVLREAFDYPYRQIADVLQLGEANVRQLVTRARKRISDERRAPVGPAEHRRLLEAFIAAAQTGDREPLEKLLSSDVVSLTDSGGLVPRAARRAVAGRERVARLVASFASHFWTGTTLAWLETNGQASVLISRDGTVIALATIEASEEGIGQILWVMNPTKLVALSG
ncbi:MAG: sigma-70 family RNA polymerase sigma factor [Myxococcaceae bacterium]|nr:sigma-70 family RNA polymerase sigma factor [Myxococcaceae bacterium]